MRIEEFELILDDIGSSIKYKKDYKYFLGQRLRWIGNFKVLKEYLNKKDKILEVGSFPSYFLATLKEGGYNIEGLDIDPNREKNFIKDKELIVEKCDIEKELFPIKDNETDKVILGEVFEHLYINPIFTMKEIRRILKKKGKLILTTPNGYSIKRIINFLKGKGASENPFDEFDKLNTVGHRGHIREYSVYELKDFLKKSGFKVEYIYYISFDHLRLKSKPFLSLIIKFLYWMLPKFRSHIIIIAKK